MSRLVFTGSIPELLTNLWFQKTSEADIRLSSYDHLTDVGGQRDGCQHLSQRKDSCFLLNKKEALSGLIQVNDDEERNGGHSSHSYPFIFLILILTFFVLLSFHYSHSYPSILFILILTFFSFLSFHSSHSYPSILLILIIPFFSFLSFHSSHSYPSILLILILQFFSFLSFHYSHSYPSILLIISILVNSEKN